MFAFRGSLTVTMVATRDLISSEMSFWMKNLIAVPSSSTNTDCADGRISG